jgi:hypothetical protein
MRATNSLHPCLQGTNQRRENSQRFWGQDVDARVRCEISREALDDNFRGDVNDKVQVFRTNRKSDLGEKSEELHFSGRASL